MDEELKKIKHNIQMLNIMMEQHHKNGQQLEENIKQIGLSLDVIIENQEKNLRENEKKRSFNTNIKEMSFPTSIPKKPNKVVGIRTGISLEKHERILDLSYHSGFPVYDILRIAVEAYIEQIDPKPRPDIVKKRRIKRGRPLKNKKSL
ncbi:hypothetical protein WJR50_21620 [Catalinimonas sp. 4WD22]|uniref:hypothetical protein n=1 Tax=Catalinimonas locisalis TaxID=3133978 RepID=UPI0031015289